MNATIRKNMDPMDEHSDAEIWNALEQVGHELKINYNINLF